MRIIACLAICLIGVIMSIHDVDKDSLDRGTPSPNTHDVLADGATKAHRTISSHYKSDADTSVGKLQMGNKQIIGNDGTTNRGLVGYNSTTNTWGVFGSKAGQDVLSSDPSKYAFSTDYNSFKIVLSGTLTVSKPANNSSGIASVTHGLSFLPAAVVYVFDTSAYQLLPYIIVSNSTGAISEIDYVTIDATYITCQIVAPNWAGNGAYTNAYSRTFKYYLLAETAN